MKLSTRISLIMSVLWIGTIYITVLTNDWFRGGFYTLFIGGLIVLWSRKFVVGRFIDKKIVTDL